MRRLHEAHREWGEVQYLFQDEATCVRACASFGIRCASVWLALILSTASPRRSVGQEIGRQNLDLRSSIAAIMKSVATGKRPDGGDWTADRVVEQVATDDAQARRQVTSPRAAARRVCVCVGSL